jgi:hypothetical protein
LAGVALLAGAAFLTEVFVAATPLVVAFFVAALFVAAFLVAALFLRLALLPRDGVSATSDARCAADLRAGAGRLVSCWA